MAEYQVDKARLGEFIAEERKRLGLTQRELAGRLYVSDKAVSKWERGLSVPDVGLLIPLADTLGVTVTELLEGRRIRPAAGMEMGEVEQVVKKALAFTEEVPEEARQGKRRRRLIWAGCVAAVALELLAFYWLGWRIGEPVWVLTSLALMFGCWAWLGIKERLPYYYDQDRISFYSDGIFKLSMPGLAFNNRNWPHIVRALRVWTVAAALLPPVMSAAGWRVFGESWVRWENFLFLGLFLGGLFLPVYLLGRRYEKG